MQWYYAIGEQRVGPLSLGEYDQLVRDGVIKPDTLVWRKGMANWQPHSSVTADSRVQSSGDTATAAGDDTEVCAVSGKRYPKREMIQFEGKWISAEHRDAFFQRLREGVIVPGHFVYGNFWPRFAAKFIDGLILGVASVVMNLILANFLLGSPNYLEAQPQPQDMRPFIIYQATSFLLNTMIGLGYSIFFIRRYSATPGKMALGLKLVRPDGSTLGVGRIIGRYFAEWLSSMILLIGYIMAAFDNERRALHDRICDTRVIKAR